MSFPRAVASEQNDRLPVWPSLDEIFVVDELTGQGTCRLPLPISPGRGNFTPELALTYNSSRRNSPFGWGWQLGQSSIGRRTQPQIPRYRDADDDLFEIDEDELTPALHASGGWVDDRFTLGDYLVQRYRRRYETDHDRVERWLHQPSGQIHWRVIDRDNITSLFGSSDETRISDPADSTRVLRWLLTERFDDRGNIMRFGYKHENLDGVDLLDSWEAGRAHRHDVFGGFRYLKRIQYGNSAPHDRFNWHFEVVLDYGDHDEVMPTVNEDVEWPARSDAYSDYRGGFESRVWRLCRRVLMFHRFEELGESPVLVGSTDLGYRLQAGTSVLSSVGYTGYIHRSKVPSQKRSIPPLMFRYQRLGTDDQIGEIADREVVARFADERNRAQWIDLEGSGMAGVVSRVGADWHYMRNLGEGRFGVAEVLPSGAHSRVAEDDVIDLPLEEASLMLAHEREYVPMTTIRATADVNQDDPFVGYIDLNGDDANDVVVADDRVIRWYPSQGEDGFADPIVIRLDPHEMTPHRLHADSRQSFHVADMTGDGLLDLVRVGEKDVVYWPNHGRGRFGEQIVMGHAPTLPAGTAGGHHVLLADLTGTGTADLVWINDGEVRVHVNVCGNQYGEARRHVLPGVSAASGEVFAVDLFGTGMASVVWLDHTNRDRLRYITPFGTQKASLMCAVANNLGSEAHIMYTTSSVLWSQDRKAGLNWLTTSAVSVSVVERVESLDDVSGVHRVQSFGFRHGHYDEADARFSGFAYMERTDGDGVPERLTKAWRHNGTTVDGRELTSFLVDGYFRDATGATTWLPGHQMPTGQLRETRQAHRSLRGQLLRREDFTVGHDYAHVPFNQEEHSYVVRQVQPARSGRPASYDVRYSESIQIEHERASINPRINHQIVLAVDDFGSVLRSAEISYGARHPKHPTQAITRTVVTENEVANRNDQPTWYRLSVPLATTRWELGGLKSPDAGLFDARYLRSIMDSAAILTDGETSELPWKRLVEKRRVRYWTNDLSRLLEHGSIESKALYAREERLVFDHQAVQDLYGFVEDIESVLVTDAHLERIGTEWWSISGSQNYDPARFYVVSSLGNGFGGTTKYRYDSASLAVAETEDAYGNVSRSQLHPRTLRTWLAVDVNDNAEGWRFDPLGAVLSRAVVGKDGERRHDSIVMVDLESSIHDDPTEVVTYDPDAWRTNGTPVWVRRRHRQTYRETDTEISDEIEYFDGLGRTAARAQRIEAGWRIVDLVERNVRGDIVRLAAPFINEDAWPDEATRKQALVTAAFFERDERGRVVRVEGVDGTLSSTEFSPWQIARHDQNDLVLDSDWYRSRIGASRGRAGDFGSPEMAARQYGARSAALAAAHAGTPVVELLDAFGEVAVSQGALSADQTIERVTRRDWRGDVVLVTDGAGATTSFVRRDMVGRAIETIGPEVGRVVTLRTGDGRVLWQRDASGRVQRFRYDSLGNCTHLFASSSDVGEYLAERTIWGGGSVNTPNGAANNLVGKPVLTLSSAGMHRVESRDITGQPSEEVVRTVDGDAELVDWRKVETIVHVEQVEALLSVEGGPSLSDATMRVATEYDARGRIVRQSGFDGSVTSRSYGPTGDVKSIALVPSDGSPQRLVVSNFERDEWGRATRFVLGNGVIVTRSYDASDNLTSIVAGIDGEPPLQDLLMTYDAVHNLMSVAEKGQLTSSYVYDPLYRLLKIEGLEPIALENGKVGVRRFTRGYERDGFGNVVEVAYRADGGVESATRFAYQQNSTLLLASTTTTGSTTVAEELYAQDATGRLVKAGAGATYIWDATGNLKVAQHQKTMRAHFGYFPAGNGLRQLIQHVDGRSSQSIRFGAFERKVIYDDGNQPVVVTADDGVVEDPEMAALGSVVNELYLTVIECEGVPLGVVERSAGGCALRYQLTDVDGSVVTELAEDGQVVTQQWFLPNGETLHVRGRTPTEVATKRLGFRGSWQQAGLGILLCETEWYAPKLGRLLAPRSVDATWRNLYAL